VCGGLLSFLGILRYLKVLLCVRMRDWDDEKAQDKNIIC